MTKTVSYENYDNKYFRASDVRNKYFNFFCRYIWYSFAPPYQKAGYATDEPLQKKKSWAPLGLCPPPPPIQNCFRRAWLNLQLGKTSPTIYYMHIPLMKERKLMPTYWVNICKFVQQCGHYCPTCCVKN